MRCLILFLIEKSPQKFDKKTDSEDNPEPDPEPIPELDPEPDPKVKNTQPSNSWDEGECTDLPNNAEYNDSSKKPSTNTKAFHDTSSTEACSFSCKDEWVDYEWKDWQCKIIENKTESCESDSHDIISCEQPQTNQDEVAGTWNYNTCECDCPTWSELGQDGSCHKEEEEVEHEYYEFELPGCMPRSPALDAECNSMAWDEWSCRYSDYCPEHAWMCECSK